jgi:flagellum-specific peptidoglycan hydrolase FlgJ
MVTLTQDERDKFIAGIAPAAKAAAAKWGVPASVTIAQAIIESGWGQSQLTIQANNFFGIKAASRFGECYVQFRTKEFVDGAPDYIVANFEKFATPDAAFDAHGELIATSTRYRPAMAEKDDPFEFAVELEKCGYSTDPEYAKKLASIIMVYNLKDFDVPPAPPAASAAAA